MGSKPGIRASIRRPLASSTIVVTRPAGDLNVHVRVAESHRRSLRRPLSVKVSVIDTRLVRSVGSRSETLRSCDAVIRSPLGVAIVCYCERQSHRRAHEVTHPTQPQCPHRQRYGCERCTRASSTRSSVDCVDPALSTEQLRERPAKRQPRTVRARRRVDSKRVVRLSKRTQQRDEQAIVRGA